MPAKAHAIALTTKDRPIAGPAWVAAAWPVRTNMPAPMTLPIPSAIRLMADSVRLSGTPPWVISSCVATSAASACNAAIGFLFHNFGIGPPDSGYCIQLLRAMKGATDRLLVIFEAPDEHLCPPAGPRRGSARCLLCKADG